MVSPVKILHLQTLKREYISAERLNKYLSLTPNINKRVGALPYDWIKSLNRENISDTTRKTGDIFENFAKEIKDIPNNAAEKKELKNAQQKLINALTKILNRNDIKISYAGYGALKHCQRLDVGNYSYAFSTFKSEKAARKEFSDYFYTGQGRGHEPQTVFVAYNRGAHGRMAKPFMANLSGIDDNGGFILSKFIDEHHPRKKPFGHIEEQRKYIFNFDPNYICGICIEAGGCIPNKKYIQNPELRNIWLHFARLLDNQIDMLQNNKKSIKVHKELIKYVTDGNNLLDFDTSIFPDEEHKIALKIIRTIDRIRKLKENLIQEKKFKTIQQILNEDLIEALPYDIFGSEFGRNNANYYPQLLADEIGISNVPDLDTMMSISAKYSDMIEINFAKYYSKSEILEWLNKYYVPERDTRLMEILQKQYDI